MTCPRCGASLPEAARFCPSCGLATDDAATIGATAQPTRLKPTPPIGIVTRRTPPAAALHKPAEGWLSASDSISHGRFAPGLLFDNRYRVIGMLGKGGMGEVYRADDLRLGQQVALKILPEGLRSDSVRLAQFHNEVRTARQVSHPNVCRVFDIGETEGFLYLTMEYVDGEDLASSLRRIGRFSEDKATEIARQLCAGLAAAHQKGVIHRDLKPANVMLDGTGRVRIMDFGLATIGHVDDVRAGTPAYMAPEQLLGREVTTRSDIFALGLVMYELFTGKRAFTAATIGELVNQHESRNLAAPSTIVSAMDDTIERAILSCLDPEPERRPASALSVAAALPGGDPLAAALAAGETPSPEMVAAAGEGVGLSARVAWPMLFATIAAVVVSYVMAVRAAPYDSMPTGFTPDVLAQKARDAIHQIGYPERPRDEAYGFEWNNTFVEYVEQNDKTPQWNAVLSQRPSPLSFWFRQSAEPLQPLTFHTDLLTPGIVTVDDPPPTTAGMIHAELDHLGRLTFFEAIPAQRQDAPTQPAPVDWTPLFKLAGLDQSAFQPAEPLWNWLAGLNTRSAWTGVWPESGRPLRVEAAALGGRPVAFMLAGPWRTPWRAPGPAPDFSTVYAVILLGTAVAILVGAGLLARKNVNEGRGDRKGAARLAAYMMAVLMALWVCDAHVVASIGFFANFLVAIATSVFYAVLLWTIYLAFEPFVRRQWPQVLVSWTNVLAGRLSDCIVGRDVLIGVVFGVGVALMFRLVALLSSGFGDAVVGSAGDTDVLLGLRSVVSLAFEEAPYAIRNVLMYFFVLFALRVLLRRQWAAAVAYTVLMGALNAFDTNSVWIRALSFVYFGAGAWVILRWGLLSYVVGMFVSALLFDIAATTNTSAWYFGNTILLLSLIVGLAVWGGYTALSARAVSPRLRPLGN